MPTAGHVLSAHAHNRPSIGRFSKGRQQVCDIVLLLQLSDIWIDADAAHRVCALESSSYCSSAI